MEIRKLSTGELKTRAMNDQTTLLSGLRAGDVVREVAEALCWGERYGQGMMEEPGGRKALCSCTVGR